MIQLDTTATYRPELAGAVDQYNKQNAIDQQFIGLKVLPMWKTSMSQAGYPVMDKENFRRLIETARAAGAGFARMDWKWGKAAYIVEENAVEVPLDRMDVQRFASVIDYELESAIGADFQVRLNAEKRVADTVMDTNVYTPTNALVAWGTTATSTPLADIDAAADKLQDKLGVARNQLTLILPRAQWKNLRNSASVIESMKNWGSGISRREAIRESIITEYLDLNEILIGTGSYDSSDEGQTQSLTQIWPTRYGMLALLAPSAAAPLKTTGLGRQIVWDGNGILPDYVTMETYDSKETDSHIVRARQFTDDVLVVPDAGEMLDLTSATQ